MQEQQKLNFEDFDTISRKTMAVAQLKIVFDVWNQERLQNYKRVGGKILSQAELDKLTAEERPKFITNLLIPIILQVIGNFKNNDSTVEGQPRTAGDVRFANIVTDLLDWLLNTCNDTNMERVRASIDALIGRVGFLVNDWSFAQDAEGKARVKRADPFRLMWDTNSKEADWSDCNYIVDSGWYTPEEILSLYAGDNPEMYAYILDKVETLLGKSENKKKFQIISWFERIWGKTVGKYLGREQGYDTDTQFLDRNTDYYDSTNGLFYVAEFHERKTNIVYSLFDPMTGQEFDITEAIEYKDGVYNQEKMTGIKSEYFQPIITRKSINQIYVTTVAPALMCKLYDAPYEIQNGNFKYTPIWCYNFGLSSLEHTSLVDQLIDPLSSYNLRRNTILTYLMKMAIGETWVEDNALGEHEDAFSQNRIGGIKYVKPGMLSKILRINPPAFPASLDRFGEEDAENLKNISGVHDNSMGTRENASESGRLFDSRVEQGDIMQSWIQDNAVSILPTVAKNLLALCKKYLPEEKMIHVLRDETNPYWLQLNVEYISILSRDKEGNIQQTEQLPNKLFSLEYDIVLSKSPFSKQAKEKDFQELMIINDALAKLNPAFVDPVTLIKAAPTRHRAEMLAHLTFILGKVEQQELGMQVQKDVEMKTGMQQQDLDMQAKRQQLQQTDNDLQFTEQVKQVVGL